LIDDVVLGDWLFVFVIVCDVLIDVLGWDDLYEVGIVVFVYKMIKVFDGMLCIFV